MEEALVARLLADGALAAQVGTRIDWGVRQHGDALPALVLNIVFPGRRYDHAGWDELGAPRLQVDCYGMTYASAASLARLVTTELEGAASASGIEFGEAFVDAERDMPVTDLGGGIKVFRRELDFLLTWVNE